MKTYMPAILKFIHNFVIAIFGFPKLYRVLWYRWLANGADYVDIECTINKIGRKYNSWGKCWEDTALHYANLANKALALQDKIGARDFLLKASLYYHLAQWGALDDSYRKLYYASCIRFFKDAVKYAPFSVESICIYHDNKEYNGYFYSAKNENAENVKKPAILLIHGADSSKEELYYFGKEAIENGFHLLIIDGPGQGEALLYNNIPMFADGEKVFSKAVDYLVNRSEVDAKKIGVFGISFGGFWSVKLAAIDTRIKTCVALGSPYSPSARIKKAPPPVWKIFYQWKYLAKNSRGHLQQTLIIALTVLLRLPGLFGANSQKDLVRIVNDFSLENVAENVRANTLIINGNKDILCQPDEQKALYNKLQCPKKLRLIDGMDHCCSKLIKISLRRQVMWWFKKNLVGVEGNNFNFDEEL
jgi:esterase/lipase